MAPARACALETDLVGVVVVAFQQKRHTAVGLTKTISVALLLRPGLGLALTDFMDGMTFTSSPEEQDFRGYLIFISSLLPSKSLACQSRIITCCVNIHNNKILS